MLRMRVEWRNGSNGSHRCPSSPGAARRLRALRPVVAGRLGARVRIWAEGEGLVMVCGEKWKPYS